MPYSRYVVGSLPWYSVLVLTGVIAALLLCSHEKKRLKLPEDTAVDLALIVLPLGIMGARAYYVLFRWDVFRADPLSVFRIWEGGLAIYGGILGGALGVWIYHRVKKLPLGTLCDCIAPGLALAQCIGRWGNFFNQEAYGLPVTDPALCFFPFAVYIEAEGGWFLATFFYESLWDLAVFVILWSTRKRARRPGDTFLKYLLCYGGGRLITEGLRMDSLMSAGGGVRVSQLLSVCLCGGVCVLFAIRARKNSSRGQRALTVALGAVMLACVWPVLTGWGTAAVRVGIGACFTACALTGTLMNGKNS